MRTTANRVQIPRPLIACLAATAAVLPAAVVTAQPAIDGVRGADAVAVLGNRLDAVAQRYAMTPVELVDLFHSDQTLWLDANDRLVYVDTAIPEFEHQPPVEPLALSGISLEDAFLLETDPGADRTIYLDFDGHHSVNNDWNHNIVFPPYDFAGGTGTFTDAELAEIIAIWKHVAEDFAPFNVNVTTKDPGLSALTRFNGGDQTYGTRCVMTQPTNGFGNGIGGIAMLFSFDDAIDDPVFVFNKGASTGGMSASHEVGHAMGLVHDGLNAQSYHPGDDSGAISWGPIMGAPFGMTLVQWSKGEYAGASTTQNDVLFINAMAPYRSDDHGDTLGSATPFTECVSTLSGIIGTQADVDVFSFTSPGGNVTMEAFPAESYPNLDIQMTLFDGGGVEMFVLDFTTTIWVSLSGFPLAAGDYYLEIDGAGLSTGQYTDYGSIGHYTVTVETECSCVGDITGDGEVGIQDFLDLLAAWGPCVGCAADLNGDGEVGIQDFLDLLAAWGPC